MIRLTFKWLRNLLIIGLLSYLFFEYSSKDTKSAISFGYLALIVSMLIFKWPRAEWLQIENTLQVLENKRQKNALIKVFRTKFQKEDQYKYVEYNVEPLMNEPTLKSYASTVFWKEETDNIVKEINASLIPTIFISGFLFLATIAHDPYIRELFKGILKEKIKSIEYMDTTASNIKIDKNNVYKLSQVESKDSTKSSALESEVPQDKNRVLESYAWLDDYDMMPTVVLPPFFSITSYFAICYLVYKRNFSQK